MKQLMKTNQNTKHAHRTNALVNRIALATILTLATIGAPSPAEAQLRATPPSFSFYGSDTTAKYEMLQRFENAPKQWFRTQFDRHTHYNPSTTRHGRKGLAQKTQSWVESDWSLATKRKETVWFPDFSFTNVHNYQNVWGKITNYLTGFQNNPVLHLNSKRWIVGEQTTFSGNFFSGQTKTVKVWSTAVLFSAQHSSGEKRFIVTVNYGVEGSSSVVSRDHEITLSPGGKTSLSLSSPSGTWANIQSIDVMEEGPERQQAPDGQGGINLGPAQPYIGISVGTQGPEVEVGITIPVEP